MSTDPLLDSSIAGPGAGSPLSGPGVTAPSLSAASSRFLSDILVELDFVTEAQADEAVQTARHPGQPTPEKVLLSTGAISEDQLARALVAPEVPPMSEPVATNPSPAGSAATSSTNASVGSAPSTSRYSPTRGRSLAGPRTVKDLPSGDSSRSPGGERSTSSFAAMRPL